MTATVQSLKQAELKQSTERMGGQKRKTYLITGASSGIGQGIATALLQRQHRLVALGRRAGETYSAQADDVRCINVDFSRLHQLVKELETLKPSIQQLDGIICCAGYGQFGGLEQFSYRQIEDLINVNFVAHAHICRTFMPLFKAQGYADIIFIASDAALKGSRQGSIYCASKFALRGFAQSLRDECARAGIRVCVINPGMVTTPFYDNLQFSPGEAPENTVSIEQIGRTVLHVLESEANTVIEEITLTPLNKVIKKP